MELPVAPRAYWKGYLKLSLVSCPIALFPATSEREKVSFHQINRKTGNRIKYRKVDSESGDEVESADIIKGYEVGKGQHRSARCRQRGSVHPRLSFTQSFRGCRRNLSPNRTAYGIFAQGGPRSGSI
jgi:hypothetical protein